MRGGEKNEEGDSGTKQGSKGFGWAIRCLLLRGLLAVKRWMIVRTQLFETYASLGGANSPSLF